MLNLEQKAFALFAIFGYIGSLFIYMIGGWDTSIETLVIFMAVDFILGLIVAIAGKSTKSKSGKISSGATLWGIARKMGVLGIVVLATRFDLLLMTDFIRNGVIIALIVYETESIAEHYVTLNWPGAHVLRGILDVFHNLYKK